MRVGADRHNGGDGRVIACLAANNVSHHIAQDCGAHHYRQTEALRDSSGGGLYLSRRAHSATGHGERGGNCEGGESPDICHGSDFRPY